MISYPPYPLMTPPQGFHDLTASRETRPIWISTLHASRQLVFEEYISRNVIHPSFLEHAQEGDRPHDAKRGYSPSPVDDTANVYGCSCSCSPALLDEGAGVCCTTDDQGEGCECVADHGNFYDAQGRLHLDALPPKHVLFECSERCACQAAPSSSVRCANSVVRRGISASVPLQVCQTAARGLGLFSTIDLHRGTFICEFAGEIIGDAETEKRFEEYRSLGIGNYILCIKEGTADTPESLMVSTVRTNIDPTRRGNVARFVNHLCPPLSNIIILPMRCDASLPGLPPGEPAPPRAALFASRDVLAGQELGYDYGDASGSGGIIWRTDTLSGGSDNRDGDGSSDDDDAAAATSTTTTWGVRPVRTACHCGSPVCRGFLPSSVQ